ncbi:MAG: 16S rRNA (cytosine(1402)-N(4))-methyltransferase RsmH [Chitinophagaceae bacterium]|nr:16S rRNA (cytosine(1402)-N(4))-methyltransferase RsmH [Chitinophagaceae bacterium]
MAKQNESLSESGYHTTVLLEEAVDALRVVPDGVYVDCTLGGGGHSRKILEKLGTNGSLYVFDQDEDAEKNLPKDKRIHFIRQNFRHIQRFLRLQKMVSVDGILADLGVSSHQFDEAERGFSTRFDADLDMRMDRRNDFTAAKLVNTYTAEKLQAIFEKFGEVTNSKSLALAIVQKREITAFKTVSGFKQSVQELVKGNPNKYFAQVFQALRMEVNDETGALKDLLVQAEQMLKPGGRMAVISFHSIEDRIVKQFFKTGSEARNEDLRDLFGNIKSSPWNQVTKKPIVPSENEIKNNPRSRSAKLRVAEKR